jgi:hypothetical protein
VRSVSSDHAKGSVNYLLQCEYQFTPLRRDTFLAVITRFTSPLKLCDSETLITFQLEVTSAAKHPPTLSHNIVGNGFVCCNMVSPNAPSSRVINCILM